MKYYLILAVLAGSVFFSVEAQSQDNPATCNDLAQLANSLEELNVTFGQNKVSVRKGGAVDSKLKLAIDELAEVAAFEEKRYLSDRIDDLDEAWGDIHSTRFLDALNRIVSSFDKVVVRECL